MKHWLTVIWNLTPICIIIDFLEEWLTDMANRTDNTLDNFAVSIIITMLRSGFGCGNTSSNDSSTA